MIREVDLVSYLPQFIAEYKETKLALTAENPEFVLVWKAADRVLKNEFIATADEYGISRFEKILGIIPSKNDSLEIRRLRVQARWDNRIPYTMRRLMERLDRVLMGRHNFTVMLDGYHLTLIVYSLNDSMNAEMQYILSVMVPMNIVTETIYEEPLMGAVYFGGVIREADIIEIKQR